MAAVLKSVEPGDNGFTDGIPAGARLKHLAQGRDIWDFVFEVLKAGAAPVPAAPMPSSLSLNASFQEAVVQAQQSCSVSIDLAPAPARAQPPSSLAVPCIPVAGHVTEASNMARPLASLSAGQTPQTFEVLRPLLSNTERASVAAAAPMDLPVLMHAEPALAHPVQSPMSPIRLHLQAQLPRPQQAQLRLPEVAPAALPMAQVGASPSRLVAPSDLAAVPVPGTMPGLQSASGRVVHVDPAVLQQARLMLGEGEEQERARDMGSAIGMPSSETTQRLRRLDTTAVALRPEEAQDLQVMQGLGEAPLLGRAARTAFKAPRPVTSALLGDGPITGGPTSGPEGDLLGEGALLGAAARRQFKRPRTA